MQLRIADSVADLDELSGQFSEPLAFLDFALAIAMGTLIMRAFMHLAVHTTGVSTTTTTRRGAAPVV